MASVNGYGSRATSSTPALQTFVPSSTFIALLEYDAANATLTTHLKSGAIYQHKQVFPMEWDKLKTSQNHGRYWSTSISGKKLSVKVSRGMLMAPETLISSMWGL